MALGFSAIILGAVALFGLAGVAGIIAGFVTKEKVFFIAGGAALLLTLLIFVAMFLFVGTMRMGP